MKKLFTIILVVYSVVAHAKTFYVSNGGNDLNDGLTVGTPIQTITKLNTLIPSLVPGDNIMFERGSTFYGLVVLTKSGTNGNPITIGAYGTGVKPLLSGFTVLNTWSGAVNGIRQASLPNGKNNLNLVSFDGYPTAVARYPNADAANAGYLNLEDFTTTVNITDNQLPTPPGGGTWVNSEMILAAKNWWTERTVITNVNGPVLTYRPSVPCFNPSANSDFAKVLVAPDKGRVFFFQRDPRLLDQYKEWYFDTTVGSKNLKIVFGAENPASHVIKAATLDTLISMSNRSFITIRDLSFEGANMMGICAKDVANCSFLNLDMNQMGSRGILVWASQNMLYDNNTFTNVLSSCIDDDSHNPTGTNHTFTNNRTHNTAPFVGMMEQWTDNDGKALVGLVTNTSLFQYNACDSSGFVGIQFQGSNVMVTNNFINIFDYVKDDGGGIYTYQSGTDAVPGTVYTNRTIKDNIVIGGRGIPYAASDCDGIYLDGRSGGILITGNTVSELANHSIYTNNPNNVRIEYNTSFNSLFGTGFARYYYSTTVGLNIARNTFFSTRKPDGSIEYINIGTNVPTSGRTIQDWMQNGIGNIDSNIYHFRSGKSYNYWYAQNADLSGLYFSTSPQLSLNGWKAFTNKDPNARTISTIPYFSLTNTIGLNKVGNSTFEASAAGTSFIGGAAPATVTWDNTSKLTNVGSVKLTFTSPTQSTAFAGMATTVGVVNSGTKYLAKFSAKGSAAYGQAMVWLRGGGNPISDTQYVSFGTTRSDFQLVFNNPTANSGAQLIMQFEQGSGTTYIDDLEFYEANATMTDYTDKVMFRYNASKTNLVLDLGAFQWKGTDNILYSGTYTIPPYKSVILTKDAPVVGNQTPTVTAGPDINLAQSITTATMAGDAHDADGTVTIVWTKISGPTGGTITNSTLLNTTITGLIPGIYTYNITATDNLGAAASDQMVINVPNLPANIPPTVNAGGDKQMMLPVNSTVLDGVAADQDGTYTVQWVQLSGPNTAIIGTSTTASTTVSGLVEGIYGFKLTVTDNNGASVSDVVQVTVDAALNVNPIADAGPDQLLISPTNSTTLTSAASHDQDGGNIVSRTWTKISGPAGGTFGTFNGVTTTFDALGVGTYSVALQVTDNRGGTASDIVQITVQLPPNQNPIASAGSNFQLTLPVNSSSLSASASHDNDGTVDFYTWQLVSGPNVPTIGTPNAVNTSIGNLIQGSYLFKVTVTDNRGGTASAQVQVDVLPAIPPANNPPTVDAGTDQILTSPPSTSTSITAVGADIDGTVDFYHWDKVSGPTSGTIVSPSSATTTLTGLVPGIYIFVITVTDDDGATKTDAVQITVNQATNILPNAFAGDDAQIALPANILNLTGSGSFDQDGFIVSYHWDKISGPFGGFINNAEVSDITLSSLQQGVYGYQLTVTDNRGGVSKDVIQVTVNAANVPPTVNAGFDLTITDPQTSVIVNGQSTDIDGFITIRSWVKLSGTGGVIETPDADITVISSLTPGFYTYQLSATDNNGVTRTDIMQITVNNLPANILPVVTVPSNLIVNLPNSSVVLTSTAVDQDGNIVSLVWVKVDGPTGGTISNTAITSPTISALTAGVYHYKLTATDNRGGVSVGLVQITVNAAPPANVNPTANAGPDVQVQLPINFYTLVGTGTDTDGTVDNYQWLKLSGPTGGSANTSGSATTLVSNLTVGTYQYQLTVVDNRGGIATDTVQVTVLAPTSQPSLALIIGYIFLSN